MPRIRALQTFVGRHKGEEFDASEDDARILCAPDLLGGQKCEYVDRTMNAVDDEPPRRGRYQRRDLRARP